MAGDIRPGRGGTGVHTPAGGKATPTTEFVDSHMKGTEAGPLLTPEGRGVVNGIPYGEQLQNEARILQHQYRFWPGAARRLRAATRAALRR